MPRLCGQPRPATSADPTPSPSDGLAHVVQASTTHSHGTSPTSLSAIRWSFGRTVCTSMTRPTRTIGRTCESATRTRGGERDAGECARARLHAQCAHAHAHAHALACTRTLPRIPHGQRHPTAELARGPAASPIRPPFAPFVSSPAGLLTRPCAGARTQAIHQLADCPVEATSQGQAMRPTRRLARRVPLDGGGADRLRERRLHHLHRARLARHPRIRPQPLHTALEGTGRTHTHAHAHARVRARARTRTRTHTYAYARASVRACERVRVYACACMPH